MSKPKRIKGKSESDNPGAMEQLAIKMVTSIYPEIFRTMIDLRDSYFTSSSDGDVKFTVSFSTDSEYKDLSISTSSTSGHREYGDLRASLRGGKWPRICPIFSKKAYGSEKYMDLCEVSIKSLRDLRKRRLRISKIIDEIDSLPSELKRIVLIEKIKNV